MTAYVLSGEKYTSTSLNIEEKHTHLVMQLSGGNQIRYIDVRCFGLFWYIRDGESEAVTGVDKLGVEPTDEALSADYLKEKLGNRKKPIKEMLHDQSIIAGIGNIYSDEILYASGLHPEIKCADLSDDEWTRLAAQIPVVIQWGIELNKMTPEEYLEGKGKDYRNTPFLKAYGHVGQPCGRSAQYSKRLQSAAGAVNSVRCVRGVRHEVNIKSRLPHCHQRRWGAFLLFLLRGLLTYVRKRV